MRSKGILLVLSGFAGAGKGTVVGRLMSDYDDYALSISATTRAPRGTEQDGVEYFFKTVEEFEQMINDDQLIEYANYVGNYYGTPKEYVQRKLDEGKNVILEIEMQGALKVKEKFPDTFLIFLVTKDAATLEQRLRGRGTDTEESILKRLDRANDEAAAIDKYDCVIVNDDIDSCVERIHQMITSERYRTSRNQELINFLKEDLKQFRLS